MPAETHLSMIFSHLINGGEVTAADALNMFGCMNLKGRIFDLRQIIGSDCVQGEWIETFSVRFGVKKRYLKYFIPMSKQQEANARWKQYTAGNAE